MELKDKDIERHIEKEIKGKKERHNKRDRKRKREE